ncbi:MAG: hypothetical protein D6722_01915, partial [Bacteroidetes bacterium]
PALPVASLRGYSPVLIALSDSLSPDSSRDVAFFESLVQLAQLTPVALVAFGPPPPLPRNEPVAYSLLWAGDSRRWDQRLAAQALFGGVTPGGRLPVSLGSWPAGAGSAPPTTRLGYAPPELVGLSSEALARIDVIVQSGIAEGAMPGCQVLVARRGQVVFHKAYGTHTYARQRRVQETDLYDLASVTKVAATTLAAMRLVSQGKLDLQAPLSRYFRDLTIEVPTVQAEDTLYWPPPDSLLIPPDSLALPPGEWEPGRPPILQQDTFAIGEDSLMIIRRWVAGRERRPARWAALPLTALLTHHSGLPAGLNVWPYMSYRQPGQDKYVRYFRPEADSLASMEVAADFFLEDIYCDSLWLAIKAARLGPADRYTYSDLNLILVQRVLDSLTGMPLDSFLYQEIYRPLGLQHIGFRPYRWLPRTQLVPTEYDLRWRGQLLRGYVHDPTA